jgi:hypothetical protein
MLGLFLFLARRGRGSLPNEKQRYKNSSALEWQQSTVQPHASNLDRRALSIKRRAAKPAVVNRTVTGPCGLNKLVLATKSAHTCRAALTTQAQRPGPQDAWIATEARWPDAARFDRRHGRWSQPKFEFDLIAQKFPA